MLERPAFADSALIDALRSGYDLEVGELTFLALGNDSVAWTYSADRARREPPGSSRSGATRGRPASWSRGSCTSPGMTEAVAVRETRDGEPWMSVGPWTILVYPLVDAPRAMDVGLDDDGWRHLGAFAARLHATTLPADLAAMVPREAFRPVATELARRVTRHVEAGPEGAAGRRSDRGAAHGVLGGHAAMIELARRAQRGACRRIRVGRAAAPLRWRALPRRPPHRERPGRRATAGSRSSTGTRSSSPRRSAT